MKPIDSQPAAAVAVPAGIERAEGDIWLALQATDDGAKVLLDGRRSVVSFARAQDVPEPWVPVLFRSAAAAPPVDAQAVDAAQAGAMTAGMRKLTWKTCSKEPWRPAMNESNHPESSLETLAGAPLDGAEVDTLVALVEAWPRFGMATCRASADETASSTAALPCVSS